MAGTASPTPEQAELGRELGAQIAANLVAKLQEMGLPAVRAGGQPAPQVDDIVLRGCFASLDQGSTGERVLVGSGSGAAEVGLRLLASGATDSEGDQVPGMASTMVEFDPRFEILPGTKLEPEEIAQLDSYETGPVKPAAE